MTDKPDRYYIHWDGKRTTVHGDISDALDQADYIGDIMVVEAIDYVDYLLENGVIEE